MLSPDVRCFKLRNAFLFIGINLAQSKMDNSEKLSGNKVYHQPKDLYKVTNLDIRRIIYCFHEANTPAVSYYLEFLIFFLSCHLNGRLQTSFFVLLHVLSWIKIHLVLLLLILFIYDTKGS